jgi:hypothetical protein
MASLTSKAHGWAFSIAPAPSRMDGRQFLAIGAALMKPPVSAVGMGVGSARRRLLVRAEQQELDCRLNEIGLDWIDAVADWTGLGVLRVTVDWIGYVPHFIWTLLDWINRTRICTRIAKGFGCQ